ncbi:MAG: hypothetical protein R3F59_24715 [Myxococcota bacterium]
MDYALWLADGTPLGSSWSWPAPFTFALGADAPPVRWAARWRACARGSGARWIPASAGFGADGRPPDIPADAPSC